MEPLRDAPPPVEPAPEAPFVELEVLGFHPAVVALPSDEAPHPLVVATHGAGGTPERYCRIWKEILDGSAFIVCPRGKRMNALSADAEAGFYYPDHPTLEREIMAAYEAALARFGARIDRGRPVYFGFSQGATMGALVLARTPFSRAILAEGGDSDWSLPSASAYLRAGGERIVFACGRPKCSVPARHSAALLRRAGVEARVVGDDAAGHAFEGAVARSIRAALPWLLEGDARFRIAGEPSAPGR